MIYRVRITKIERDYGIRVIDNWFDTKHEAEVFRENESHKKSFINGTIKLING